MTDFNLLTVSYLARGFSLIGKTVALQAKALAAQYPKEGCRSNERSIYDEGANVPRGRETFAKYLAGFDSQGLHFD